MTPETVVDEFYKHIRKHCSASSYDVIKQCIDECPEFDVLTRTRIPPLLYAMFYTCNMSIIRLLTAATIPNYKYKVLHEYFVFTPYDLFTNTAQSQCEKHYRDLRTCPTCKHNFEYEAHVDFDCLIYMNVHNLLSIYYHRALGTRGFIYKQCMYEYEAQGYMDSCYLLEFSNENYFDIELYNYVRECCCILDIDIEFIATRTLDFPPDMCDYDTYNDIPYELKF